MAEREFFLDDARTRTSEAIREVEARTSAEVVVALRKRSGHYRHTDYLVGMVTGTAMLVLVLFVPQEFALEAIPLNMLVGFALGALACASSAPIRRLFTAGSLLRGNAELAAKAAFVDQGISRTSGRSGILIHVSMLEREVVVVPDAGIDPDLLGAPWTEAVAALQASVRGRPDLEAFLAAVKRLGPVLGKELPRQAGDVNELSDELRA